MDDPLAVVLTEIVWFLEYCDIQSDALNLFMVFYTAFKNWTDLSRKNLRSNINFLDIKQQNYPILTSFTIFRQSNYGQIKIKSNS